MGSIRRCVRLAAALAALFASSEAHGQDGCFANLPVRGWATGDLIALPGWGASQSVPGDPFALCSAGLGVGLLSDGNPYLNWALGQLIYDVPDDADGLQSAMRGHSLARTLYGFNDQVLNTQPFNGTGRLHFVHQPGSGPISGVDDYHLINYQRFDAELIRDPERYGTRADTSEPRQFFTGGFNVPYTYPDANNLFLAAVAADGSVITPSFHRNWIFGPLEASNSNWSTPQGKYLVLRPRPAEMGDGFPFPPDPMPGLRQQGDVKNRVGAPGGNDSIWIDLAYPVQHANDGRKFKPLFAPLILDLDNHVDLHVHGDVLGNHPALTPWLWDRALESLYAMPADDPDAPPAGPEVPFPDFGRRGEPNGNPGDPVPQFSDLRTPGRAADDPETDWRGFRALSQVAQGIDFTAPDADDRAMLNRLAAGLLWRVDLNARLLHYPHEHPFTTPARRARALLAQVARQRMAEDLYRRLLLVTGTPAVADAAIQTPPDQDLAARRWLAQLAVNIVDYIDDDDISTPFNFYSPLLDGLPLSEVARSTATPAGEQLPRYWVFGTELPSVVLNEVMTEYAVPDPTTPGVFRVKVWAELYHPVSDIPAPDPGRPPDVRPLSLFARTAQGGYSPYRIVIGNTNASPRTPLFDHADNVLGSPELVFSVAEFLPTLATVGNPNRAVPSAIGPDRFLIVGPQSDEGQDAQATIRPSPTRLPATRWHQSDGMEYQSPSGDPAPITVLLRRLANPHLPPDPAPAVGRSVNPFYNPYITVDYLERVPLQSAALPTQSAGKLQPYAARLNRVLVQTAEQGGGTRHTLGEANQPSQQPFDWLVHLDRRLISPMELLSVSGVRPHQLTHRFITTAPGSPPNYAHRVPWFDEDLASIDPPRSHRLYRLFELVQTADRRADGGPRGRVPGKINLNTIFDFETFLPLFGARADVDQVREIWTRLLQLRSPGVLDPEPTVTAADRPFLSSEVGILPASDPQANGRGVNIDDTIFRAWDPGARGDQRRLFDSDGEDHPYLRSQLLTTLYERSTSRSNVFAVWLTVGFFEVIDDAAQPVRLGAEIGQAEGRQVRHRFFAIVDRTNLQFFGLHTTGGKTLVHRYLTRSAEQGGAVPSAGRHWVRLEALEGLTATEQRDASGERIGPFFDFKATRLTRLFVDTGSQREIVVVTDVDPTRNAIQAVFSRPHAAGFEVSIPGNPGPQPDFDARSALYRDVVRLAITLR